MDRMKLSVFLLAVLQVGDYVRAEIRTKNVLINKLRNIKPVGGSHTLMPLTAMTPEPLIKRRYHVDRSGRRHLIEDCTDPPKWKEIEDGPHVDIVGDYYDDGALRTVATVIIPEHLDHKHFEITTPVPYLTVGTIDAIGYHPSTIPPDECELIYRDFIAEDYTDESMDNEEESIEIVRVTEESTSTEPGPITKPPKMLCVTDEDGDFVVAPGTEVPLDFWPFVASDSEPDSADGNTKKRRRFRFGKDKFIRRGRRWRGKGGKG